MADIFDLFKQIAKKEETTAEPISWLIVGLGNPGDKYRMTRHNAGFLTLDFVAEKCSVKIDRVRFHALCTEAQIGKHRVLLMKPQTMMNASGIAVQEAAAFYKISPDRVLIVSDDITQAPGKLRVRRKGSAGGHNGLKSIIEYLGTDAFPRLRVGVGEKPHPDFDLADWVVSEFRKEEREKLFATFPCSYEGIRKILDGDFDGAMQLCNSFTPPAKE